MQDFFFFLKHIIIPRYCPTCVVPDKLTTTNRRLLIPSRDKLHRYTYIIILSEGCRGGVPLLYYSRTDPHTSVGVVEKWGRDVSSGVRVWCWLGPDEREPSELDKTNRKEKPVSVSHFFFFFTNHVIPTILYPSRKKKKKTCFFRVNFPG